jgi:hypothetical protein
LCCHKREENGDHYDIRVVALAVGEGSFLIVLIHIWQDLDAAQQKTHLAVTLALGEISIVESCVAVWDDLAAIGAIQAE